jgi:hypothetical protein
MAPLLLAIVQDEVTNDAGAEIRYGRGFRLAVLSLLHSVDARPALLIALHPAPPLGSAAAMWLRELTSA